MTTINDDGTITDTAVDGISKMLDAALPSSRGFAVITFRADGSGRVEGRASKHTRGVLAKKLREAADAVDAADKRTNNG